MWPDCTNTPSEEGDNVNAIPAYSLLLLYIFSNTHSFLHILRFGTIIIKFKLVTIISNPGVSGFQIIYNH